MKYYIVGVIIISNTEFSEEAILFVGRKRFQYSSQTEHIHFVSNTSNLDKCLKGI